jgi:hypothetical protein
MTLYVIEKGKTIVTITGSSKTASSNVLYKDMTFMARDLIETKDGQHHFCYQSINYYVDVGDVRVIQTGKKHE